MYNYSWSNTYVDTSKYIHTNIIRRFDGDLDKISNKVLNKLSNELESQIISKLLEFPEMIKKCLVTLEPQNISNYLTELSSVFHSYYAKERVIDSSDISLSEARIYLINAIRIVIRNGLSVLGISCPKKM